MFLFTVLLIMYGIPAIAGILLLRWLILKFYTRKKANVFTIVSFSVLILLGAGYLIWECMQRTHYMYYSFCGDIKIELYALEIDTFRDWQVIFEMTVKNQDNQTIKEFKFDAGNGPYFEIAFLGNSSKTIVINGYDRNIGFDEIVTLDGFESQCNQKIRINGNFEIEEL